MKRLVYILFSCALVLAGLEIACRTLLADRVPRAFVSTLAFEHDPLLGWFPVPDSAGEFEGSRKISIRHNHHGFRDRERSAEKPLPRVAFLGDSFVWGYDVEREDRFTELLQGHVPDYEIVNLGVA